MAKMGRPSKLTPEMQKQISDLLLGGNFVETVCDFVGIDYSLFYKWMKRGERGAPSDIEGGYVDFFHTIKKAIAQVEMTTLYNLRQGDQYWQRNAWWLERRHPDKWGNRGKSELNVKITDVSKLSDDELLAIVEDKGSS